MKNPIAEQQPLTHQLDMILTAVAFIEAIAAGDLDAAKALLPETEHGRTVLLARVATIAHQHTTHLAAERDTTTTALYGWWRRYALNQQIARDRGHQRKEHHQ